MLYTYTVLFQVIFKATTGSSYTSDIAIDDIYFTKGSCRGEKFSFENASKESGGNRQIQTVHIRIWVTF